MLQVEEDKIILTDLKSKFGTLVMANEFHEIKVGKKLVLQIGRTVFEVALEEQKRKGACCTSPEVEDTNMFAMIGPGLSRKELDISAKFLFNPQMPKKKSPRHQDNS